MPALPSSLPLRTSPDEPVRHEFVLAVQKLDRLADAGIIRRRHLLVFLGKALASGLFYQRGEALRQHKGEIELEQAVELPCSRARDILADAEHPEIMRLVRQPDLGRFPAEHHAGLVQRLSQTAIQQGHADAVARQNEVQHLHGLREQDAVMFIE